MNDSSRSRLTLPVLFTGTFMGFLDLWMMIVAVPSIAAGLHTGAATAQLVLSIYVVAYGATLVIGGRLGDRYGRRRMFAWGTAGFALTSAACAVAPSITALIVLRALQGVAGAAMLPQVLATIHATHEGAGRRQAVLLYTSVIGAAAAFGQVIGGGLLSLDVLGLGWRVLFLINVPIGIASLILIPRAVPETRAPRTEPIDVPGAVVLALSLVLVLLGLGIGPNDSWSPIAWLMVAAGLAVGALLPVVERRRPTPLLPAALLRQRSVRWGLVATVAFYVNNNAVFIGFTLFLQDGLHLGPLSSGAAFLPFGLAYMAVTLAGRSARTPGGPSGMLVGAGVMVTGLAVTIAVAPGGGGAVPVAAALALYGAGLGLVYPAIVATVLSRVRPGDEGAATGVLLTTTQASNALGIAMATAVWTAAGGWLIADRLSLVLAIAVALATGVAGAALALRARRAEPAPAPIRAPAGSAPAPTE